MNRHLKTVSMFLFLSAMSGGIVNATPMEKMSSTSIVLQDETCTGVVNDAMGPVIGASVVVKGTTNGVITEISH